MHQRSDTRAVGNQTYCRVDPANRLLSDSQSSVVDRRQNGRKRRCRRRRPRDQSERAVYRNGVVEAIRGDVGVSPTSGVEDSSRVRGREILEVPGDRRLLEVWAREDIGKPTARGESLEHRALAIRDLVPGDDLRGADGGHIRASSGERGVEAGRAEHLLAVVSETRAIGASHTGVAGRVNEGDAGQAELPVLCALALHVRGGEVRLLIAVGRRDDVCGRLASTVLSAFVSARAGIGVYAILARIVAALERAVRAVDAVEEVVERPALDCIARLVKKHLLLLADKTKDVLQIETRLSECTTGCKSAAVDADDSGALADLALGVVAEEDVKVGRVVGLGGIFNCTTITCLR